jgi:nitrite reductase/ring-hydroxylating ferredoxin subunit
MSQRTGGPESYAAAGAPPENAAVARRSLLRGVAVGGLTLPLLAACGSDDSGGPASDGAADSGSSGGSDGGSGGGSGVVATADVPVGGGTILADAAVVVTQPTEGEFRAFTAVCTHQQCKVASIADGSISCPCHGSTFSIEDGSVQGGPAPAPLAEKQVTVEGDQVSVS